MSELLDFYHFFGETAWLEVQIVGPKWSSRHESWVYLSQYVDFLLIIFKVIKVIKLFIIWLQIGKAREIEGTSTLPSFPVPISSG